MSEITYSAAAAADMIAKFVGTYRQANVDFCESARFTAATLASGVKAADVAAAVKARNVGTYGSVAAIHYHAIMGQFLALSAEGDESLPTDVSDDYRRNVQSIIAALYQNKCSRELRKIIAEATGQASALAAMIAANDARIIAESSAIVATPSADDTGAEGGEGGESGEGDAPESDPVADVQKWIDALTGPASKLAQSDATPEQAAAVKIIIDNLAKFAGTVANGAPQGTPTLTVPTPRKGIVITKAA